MNESSTPYLDKKLSELVQPSATKISLAEQERHRIYAGALSKILTSYWSSNKYGVNGDYPLNPDPEEWRNTCPHLLSDYRGHNIAALAVDHKGHIIDFDFNHNALFDSSVEHAEARLIKRIFSLSQIQDAWVYSDRDNPADRYSNALSKVTVYTSLESCTQCTGIMMLGRVKNVIYLQTDPGMYRIGDLLHTMTARKKKEDFIRAPEPISASRIKMNIVNDLDNAFARFSEKPNAKPYFYSAHNSSYNAKRNSITSFLCTEAALKPFSNAADAFDNTNIKYKTYKPKRSGDTDSDIRSKLSNKSAYSKAKKFVSYAIEKGHRGTPHK